MEGGCGWAATYPSVMTCATVKLVVNTEEAAKVGEIFTRFVEVGSATVLARELRGEGTLNKKGKLIDKGYLYRLLNNRVYRGLAVHKGKAYPGEHTAIIDERLWDQVHDIFGESPRKRANNSRSQTPALLKGLIFTATGAAMTPVQHEKGRAPVSVLRVDGSSEEPRDAR